MYSWYRHKGFTQLEIVITISIAAIVLLATGQFVVQMFRNYRAINQTLTSNEQARRAVINFVNELRTSSTSDTGSYPIALATPTSITFYSNIDSDVYKERLRYYVNGNSLIKGTTKPSGNPITYSDANETSLAIVQNLTNVSQIFSYYDTNYNGTGDALPLPIDVISIRTVKIDLSIDQSAIDAPAAYQLSSQVNIRNLKDNL